MSGHLFTNIRINEDQEYVREPNTDGPMWRITGIKNGWERSSWGGSETWQWFNKDGEGSATFAVATKIDGAGDCIVQSSCGKLANFHRRQSKSGTSRIVIRPSKKLRARDALQEAGQSVRSVLPGRKLVITMILLGAHSQLLFVAAPLRCPWL